jgi:D-amino-acid dehydrogenase
VTAGRQRVAVVGAGIVGVCCASYLQRDGHDVTLVERDAPGAGTSQGNAGALSPGSCVPLALPGVFRKIPGWIADADGPLTIRPRYLPRALPWLARFALSARSDRVSAVADALRALHRHVYDCYEPLVDAAACADLIRRAGTLVVYRSEAAFRESAREWRLRTERGAAIENVAGGALREIEPALAADFTHGVYLPDHGHTVDPHRLVQALAAHFIAAGGRMERAEVTAIECSVGDRVVLRTGNGRIEADRVVIAAGAWSGTLVASLGLDLPLETQRGYQVTLTDPGIALRVPVAAAEAKVYATPMVSGLRVAGTVEFAGLAAAPDYRRARRLLPQAQALFPRARTTAFTEWMGHRPCLPDSLPAIGPAPRNPHVILAFGHGHNGMTSGPVTGRIVAELIGGRTPLIDPAPYAPARFRG